MYTRSWRAPKIRWPTSKPILVLGPGNILTNDHDRANLGLVQLGRFSTDSVTRRLECLKCYN
ncbi:hypothetical protein DPMN_079293 [Dreissena polymorpha]|uniref:Uncharacterized protein n=1 Tax=Dreissena polymorpha TaxID=45954 RepID=A0A9D4BSV6_DREPO|nr:hypothetical protein DPMN_079293 [Dreissena polymorpha]